MRTILAAFGLLFLLIWAAGLRAQTLQKTGLPSVVLPIEVTTPLQPQVNVWLPIPAGSTPKTLILDTQGIMYPTEASIQFGNATWTGPWIPLDNHHCRAFGPGTEFG